MTDTHIGLCMIDQGVNEKPVSHTVVGRQFSLKKPTVLYFGGRKTTSFDYACKGIRLTEKFLAPLKIKRDKVNFLSVCYQGLSIEQAIAEKLLHRLKKQRMLLAEEEKGLAQNRGSLSQAEYPNYLHELYEAYFKPLLTKPSGTGDLVRLPLADACKNLRNINIVAHSHGACIVSIFGDLLHKKMLGLGYTQNEAAAAQREVFVLTAGTTVLLGVSKFTTVNFVSRSDLKVVEGFIPKSRNRILCRRMPRPPGGCQFYAVSGNESVLAVDRLCIQTAQPNDTTEHKFKNYLADGEDKKTPAATVATQIALNIFQAGVFNSIYNRRSAAFEPLKTALKNIVNPALSAAKKAGKDELTALAQNKGKLKQAVRSHIQSAHPALFQSRLKTMGG